MNKTIFMVTVALLPFIASCRGNREDNLKLMTFNIRYDNPDDSLNAWPNREGIAAGFINDEKPDIIGMQEVLWHQYENLDSLLEDYSSVGAGRDDGARGGEMNPVFFRKERFDMARSITFWLSETPQIPGSKAWEASLPRIVTWVELVEKKSHEHIFFFNTHFAHDSDSARQMSARLLLKQVDTLTRGGFKFFVTGDFNMTRTSKGYELLTGPQESVPLLQDSYVISSRKPQGPAFTFNGFEDVSEGERIDFIFVKEGTKVLSHNTFRIKEHGVFISDHWPVETVISLK